MPSWSPALLPRGRLLWVAVGLGIALMALAESAIDTDYAGRWGMGTALPGVAVGALLALSPRWPAAAAVLGATTVAGNLAMGLPGPGGAQLIGMGLLVGHAAAVLPLRRSLLATAGAAAVCMVLGVVVVAASPWEAIFYSLILGSAWCVGLLVRQTRARSVELQVLAARLAEQQEAVAASAVVAERARIAREVHDSVAHSVSVMVLQMGGLRRLLPDHPEAQDVLLGLERLGREAVEEMRRVVGILREQAGGDPAPQPSLSRLDEVLDELRAGGMPVELTVTGQPVELPQLVDVSAVRVVQEALSNVVRHAGAAATCVRVDWAGDRVGVSVTDDGRPTVPAPRAGGGPAAGGHGQLHMRERVAVAGGTLEVGPVRGGGYRVRATFPVPVAVTA
ncbi:histidine kinase [Blastococcus sp. SYSU DS0753]